MRWQRIDDATVIQHRSHVGHGLPHAFLAIPRTGMGHVGLWLLLEVSSINTATAFFLSLFVNPLIFFRLENI